MHPHIISPIKLLSIVLHHRLDQQLNCIPWISLCSVWSPSIDPVHRKSLTRMLSFMFRSFRRSHSVRFIRHWYCEHSSHPYLLSQHYSPFSHLWFSFIQLRSWNCKFPSLVIRLPSVGPCQPRQQKRPRLPNRPWQSLAAAAVELVFYHGCPPSSSVPASLPSELNTSFSKTCTKEIRYCWLGSKRSSNALRLWRGKTRSNSYM